PTGQQCFDLRGKCKMLFILPIVKRLDTETISGSEQAPASFVPDGKRKHTVEFFEAGCAPFPVRIKDDFRVTVGAKAVSFARQHIPYIAVVINLPVIGDPEASF